MNADNNVTYQDRMSGAPAWRTEAQGREDIERETERGHAVDLRTQARTQCSPNTFSVFGEHERGQCHVPGSDAPDGRAGGRRHRGGRREAVDGECRNPIRFDDACAGDERRQCAQAMNADNVTCQGLARRTGELADGGTGTGGEKRSTVSVGIRFGSTTRAPATSADSVRRR